MGMKLRRAAGVIRGLVGAVVLLVWLEAEARASIVVLVGGDRGCMTVLKYGSLSSIVLFSNGALP